MSILGMLDRRDSFQVGEELHAFAKDLFPICRSITGEGFRQTLSLVGERIPLQVSEIPTGTPVFDWAVPKEWNIRQAYINGPDGSRIVDFAQNNLHVVSYSVAIHATMPLSQLRGHLFTLPDRPEWIPYRTSYYQAEWGFCLTHTRLLTLREGKYEVCIDSTLEDGSLTYAECFLPGFSEDEVLISCHACHPSLANDNLSGITVATALAKQLAECNRHYSYRFLFIPGTIGAITWLAHNQDAVHRIRHGLVLTCLGDAGGFHYKKSRQGDAEIDRAASHVLRQRGEPSGILPFSPYGYDERQYCSPGFNLPVGCLMRSVWGTFPEYHTSADNLEFIKPASLADSLHVCTAIVDILENNGRYRSLNPYCEPHLGKRNLYRSKGGDPMGLDISARLWVLNLSDKRHSLLDIAERSGLPFKVVHDAAKLLEENGLLTSASDVTKMECQRKNGVC